MTNDPIIKIEQLEKSFGDLHVLKGIDPAARFFYLAREQLARLLDLRKSQHIGHYLRKCADRIVKLRRGERRSV